VWVLPGPEAWGAAPAEEARAVLEDLEGRVGPSLASEVVARLAAKGLLPAAHDAAAPGAAALRVCSLQRVADALAEGRGRAEGAGAGGDLSRLAFPALEALGAVPLLAAALASVKQLAFLERHSLALPDDPAASRAAVAAAAEALHDLLSAPVPRRLAGDAVRALGGARIPARDAHAAAARLLADGLDRHGGAKVASSAARPLPRPPLHPHPLTVHARACLHGCFASCLLLRLCELVLLEGAHCTSRPRQVEELLRLTVRADLAVFEPPAPAAPAAPALARLCGPEAGLDEPEAGPDGPLGAFRSAVALTVSQLLAEAGPSAAAADAPYWVQVLRAEPAAAAEGGDGDGGAALAEATVRVSLSPAVLARGGALAQRADALRWAVDSALVRLRDASGAGSAALGGLAVVRAERCARSVFLMLPPPPLVLGGHAASLTPY
jgi:hypothetical protein